MVDVQMGQPNGTAAKPLLHNHAFGLRKIHWGDFSTFASKVDCMIGVRVTAAQMLPMSTLEAEQPCGSIRDYHGLSMWICVHG
jgi:hypothetical protein